MNRRDLLKAGALAGVGSLYGAVTPNSRCPTAIPQPEGRAKNVIFLAYDGFTWEDIGSAQIYARRHLGRPLALERLISHGASGSIIPSSLTSAIPDSAAATTAWATGRKIVSGSLSMYPDGTALDTVLRLAQDKGLATGLITTTRLTHATPAGWYAQIDWRRREEDIALQLIENPPELLLGGGRRVFDSQMREDGQDLYDAFTQSGMSIVRSADKLQDSHASKLLGVFSESHLPYEIDRRFQDVETPTLNQMVTKGLDVLDGYDDGFLLQVEAGRIDHANHRNDAGSSLWEILAADEALATIMDFVDERPDTLLILASDHGTGGGAVYGVGERYRLGSQMHDEILKRQASFPFIIDEMLEHPFPDHIRDVALAYTGVSMTYDQARLMANKLTGERELVNDTMAYDRQPYNTLAFCLKGGTYDQPDRLNINYATGQHTAGPVPCAAYGAGTENLRFGMIDNTDLYTWMTGALGIEHENPEMLSEEALELISD